ncbi:MAG: DUF4238 domain-containing protein [Bacteroidia bacterium]|nr:DUF4238 domain-containing protein [Bacteroidia bacterium]
MKTDKKNQHYIPKFFLRNFSYLGNRKELGIFDLNNSFYFQRAKLKTQGSKNFYYGMDGKIEAWLEKVETNLAILVQEIIKTKKGPQKFTPEHRMLLAFVSLTHLRNPIPIRNIIESFEKVKQKALELDPNANVDELLPKVNHEKAVEVSLSMLTELIDIMLDLDYKVLVNQTKLSFIASDFPVVRYNQLLEKKGNLRGKAGYGSLGLQIFIPLNPKIGIILYDPEIYKVGHPKKSFVNIISESDVEQLNILQILNGFKTVFFNESISESRIKSMYSKSKGFSLPNRNSASRHDLIKPDKSKGDLIVVTNSECEIGLKLMEIKFKPSVNNLYLDPTIAQIRKWPMELRKRESV